MQQVLIYWRISPNFIENGGSLPHLPEHVTCPSPMPDEYSPCPASYLWTSNLILESQLSTGLRNSLFPSGFLTKPCMHLSSPHRRFMLRPSNSSWFVKTNNIWWRLQLIKLLITQPSLLLHAVNLERRISLFK